jgi:hypothetical protein
MSSNLDQGEVHNIYVKMFVSDFLLCSSVSSTNKTDRHDITEILFTTDMIY